MSPNWRKDNDRWKLHCGVAEGVVFTIPRVNGRRYMWRVDVNDSCGFCLTRPTVAKGKAKCEEMIRDIANDIKEGLGE